MIFGLKLKLLTALLIANLVVVAVMTSLMYWSFHALFPDDPELDYKNLEIQSGDVAMNVFPHLHEVDDPDQKTHLETIFTNRMLLFDLLRSASYKIAVNHRGIVYNANWVEVERSASNCFAALRSEGF